jgi:histidinol dehydrogenase
VKVLHCHHQDFDTKWQKILKRRERLIDRFSEEVEEIIKNYRLHREQALIDLAKRYDGVELNQEQLWVEPDQIKNSHKVLSPEIRLAVDHTIKRVERFQTEMRRSSFQAQLESGVYWGVEVKPLERVGIYVPHSYFLTAILCAVPAKLAGVKEIVLATPPQKKFGAPFVDPALLYVAKVFDVQHILVSGGVGALSAMAFGAEAFEPVQKIVGPTGKLGMVAKQKLSGYVGIDMFAGPTDIAFVGDKTSSKTSMAADIIALADHNPEAEIFVFHENEDWLQSLLELMINALTEIKEAETRESIRQCFEDNMHFILTKGHKESIERLNQLAPGIAILSFQKAHELKDRVKACGCLLLGAFTPPVSLDLIGGGTGIVPTLGTAAFSSMSSPAAYQRIYSVVELDQEALARLQRESIELSKTEGFMTHSRVFESRLPKV